MSGAFVVDTDRLDQVVAQLEALERTASTIVDEVQQRVDAIAGFWTGDAAVAARAAHEEWLAGAHDMQTALAALRALTRTAHENYTGAIAANQRMWG